MTINDISYRIERLKEIKGDDEAAHCEEDAMYADFIEHVAIYGSRELRLMAEKLLKTKDIDFARWCA